MQQVWPWEAGVHACVPRPPSTMVYLDSFDDFEKAAERVYLNAPMKVKGAAQRASLSSVPLTSPSPICSSYLFISYLFLPSVPLLSVPFLSVPLLSVPRVCSSCSFLSYLPLILVLSFLFLSHLPLTCSSPICSSCMFFPYLFP